MLEGENWMGKYHSRPGPTHNILNSLFHVWPITMDGAFPASGFGIAVMTMFQPLTGVTHKFETIRTKFSVSFMLLAV